MDNEENYVGLRVMDGNEVVGKESKGLDGQPRFSQLLRVAIHPSGQATLLPYVDIESFDEKIKIKEEHIILRYKPMGSILEQHKGLVKLLKQKASGIVTPPDKKIITNP